MARATAYRQWSYARAWLRNDNAALGGRPLALIQSVPGLVHAVAYLDARTDVLGTIKESGDLSDETEQMNGEVWHTALAIVWVALGRVWARALPASAATGLGFVLFTCHLSSERRVPESGRSPPAISCWPRRYGWRLWALACCEVGGHRPWRTSARSVW